MKIVRSHFDYDIIVFAVEFFDIIKIYWNIKMIYYPIKNRRNLIKYKSNIFWLCLIPFLEQSSYCKLVQSHR